ncbi:MAG: hypothetical protein QNJ60_11340 [Xenococcaceae cyanobacterium MO_188.B19]|nr:hypothetical protein [Xenococcaceae cyanobacterium MO_188.B19]
MILLLSFMGFVAASFIIYVTFHIGDDIESQMAIMLALVILLLSFLLAPLWFKLIMLLLLAMIYPLISNRISLSFYRQLNR